LKGLEKDLPIYEKGAAQSGFLAGKKLRAPASLNSDSDAEVGSYLKKSGQVKIFFPRHQQGEILKQEELASELLL